MYNRKSVEPRMESWGTPALTEYFCEEFPSRTTQRHLVFYCSLLHLMPVMAYKHTSTCTPSVMCVKNSTHLFCLWHLLSVTLEQRNEWENKNIKFLKPLLTFCYLECCTSLQNKGKFFVWSEYYLNTLSQIFDRVLNTHL